MDVVWRTITEPDQISLWFADRVELVAEPGGHGAMYFGDEGEGGILVLSAPSALPGAHAAGDVRPGSR